VACGKLLIKTEDGLHGRFEVAALLLLAVIVGTLAPEKGVAAVASDAIDINSEAECEDRVGPPVLR